MKSLMFSALLCVGALPAAATDRAAVVSTYVEIAAATYGDSLIAAKALQDAVNALISKPSIETLQAARTAWIAARVPYQQSEVFRFGNPVVDDWEGRVNSWPLDEGLIDYVAPTYGGATDDNGYAALNVIATPRFTLSGKDIDATRITPALIAGTLQEADGIEANVASGYHAIEFLLWGQDLNGTGPGAGNRPFTDYVQGTGCTGGNCDRRADYLQSATALLVADLTEMVADWSPTGPARAAVTTGPDAGLTAILTGLGSLAYGEMAGDRMKLGLMLNDPEEEHDCFSDNTHNSHYYDGQGMMNVFLGHYQRLDGSVIEGPSLSDLVAATDPAVGDDLRVRFGDTMKALGAIKAAAEGGMAYDQMLASGNAEGSALIEAAIAALVAQTGAVERATATLGLDRVTSEGGPDTGAAAFQ